ncbi:hypothetical protein Ctob_000226 [Chrysochromulina tobinii]|uniref:Uncharacterized protein n=1 Tax=Chrysochromulina tobinii TaxID=1460289 RepID=A0A0M0J9S1_9EUKA|nr:hypothetical protein Ctob_000226 [Chrysochromulina tobinii]|eukprot:KOO23321.1 hypothetical protein Ctob_000226 [Chrysochromulina sp. CCMP291]
MADKVKAEAQIAALGSVAVVRPSPLRALEHLELELATSEPSSSTSHDLDDDLQRILDDAEDDGSIDELLDAQSFTSPERRREELDKILERADALAAMTTRSLESAQLELALQARSRHGYVRLHFEVEHGKPPPPVAEYFAAPSRAPAHADDVSVTAASHDDEALSSPDEAERRAGRDPDEAERRAGRDEPPADAAEAAMVASDLPETTPGAPYRAQVNFGALASVCLELCVNVGRLDHLLGPIYTLFCTSSRSREAYLLALEPFIVTRRVPRLPGALLLNMARLFALPPCDPGSAAALTGHVGASSWALTGHPSAVASASVGEPGVVGGWEHCLIAADCD